MGNGFRLKEEHVSANQERSVHGSLSLEPQVANQGLEHTNDTISSGEPSDASALIPQGSAGDLRAVSTRLGGRLSTADQVRMDVSRRGLLQDFPPLSRVLQRGIGNRAVQRLMAHSHSASAPVNGASASSAAAKTHPMLRLGAPHDVYEQEADAVARHVLRLPEGASTGGTLPTIRPLSAPAIQRDGGDAGGLSSEVNEQIHSEIERGGTSIPLSVRQFFGPRLGVDLSPMRLHTGAEPAHIAAQLDARALTVGQHLMFGQGEFQPETASGKHLIAHELSHALQQTKGNSSPVIQRYMRWNSVTQNWEAENGEKPVGSYLSVWGDVVYQHVPNEASESGWDVTPADLPGDIQAALFAANVQDQQLLAQQTPVTDREPVLDSGLEQARGSGHELDVRGVGSGSSLQPPPPRNLKFAYPSTGTGDYWHVLAASVLHSHYSGGRAEILFGQAHGGRRDLMEKAERQRADLQANLASIGQDGLSVNVPVDFTDNPSPSNRAWVDAITASHRAVDRGADIVDQKVSTAVFMRYILEHGTDAIAHLRQALTRGATDEEMEWVLAQARRTIETVNRARAPASRSGSKPARLLLINRREGHENPHHNTSDEQYDYLSQLAASPRYNLLSAGVAVGSRPRAGDYHLFEPMGPAPAATDGEVVRPLPANDEKRRTALFWAVMADLQRMGFVHGLIGGRSGSMDIAALMGMNTLSWDLPWMDQRQHNRLAQTHPLMSVTNLVQDTGYFKGKDIKSWLSGKHVAPRYRGRDEDDPQLESGEFLMYAIRHDKRLVASSGREVDTRSPIRLDALKNHTLTARLLAELEAEEREEQRGDGHDDEERDRDDEAGDGTDDRSLGHDTLKRRNDGATLPPRSGTVASSSSSTDESGKHKRRKGKSHGSASSHIVALEERQLKIAARENVQQLAHDHGVLAQFRIGHADGTQQNCAIHSLLEAAEHPVDARVAAQIRAAMIEHNREIPPEGPLDLTNPVVTGALFAVAAESLGGRRLVAIMVRQQNLEVGVVRDYDQAVLVPGADPPIYVFYAYGHFSPAWPRN